MDALENKFHYAMMNIYYLAKKEINYNATRFLQLVTEKGGLQAAKQLIAKEGGTYGFEVLWEHNCLKLSVEALVLEPEYEALFSNEERRLCIDRLEQYGYKIT